MNPNSKQFYITILWTVIVCIIALVVWMAAPKKAKKEPTVQARTVVASVPSQSSTFSLAPDRFVLLTLNDLVVSTDDGQFIGINVIAFKKLIERVKRVVVIYTVPEEQVEETETVEKNLVEMFEGAGLFDDGLKRHRLLLTETVEGRISIARELQPAIFIDSDSKVIEEITGKVSNAVCLSQERFKRYITETFGPYDDYY
jgi:hypothetical protein